MTQVQTLPLQPERPVPRRPGRAVAVAAGIVAFALWETVVALLAPLRAPDDRDWRRAESVVRADFKPGDLIVAAPFWSDQVMRLHLGDLVPLSVAARLDAARFGRIWQISQRGAVAPETASATLLRSSRHGGLQVSLFEQRPAPVTFDFVERWAQAQVMRHEPGRGDIPCERQPDRHQCPLLGFNFVMPRVLETDGTLHRGLYAEPVGGAAVVVEYKDVPMGRELAVGHGLHDPWWRRAADGTVRIKVLVNGVTVGEQEATNRNGWKVIRIDTSAQAGKTAVVRFEITSAKPYARRYGFAAEARN